MDDSLDGKMLLEDALLQLRDRDDRLRFLRSVAMPAAAGHAEKGGGRHHDAQ